MPPRLEANPIGASWGAIAAACERPITYPSSSPASEPLGDLDHKRSPNGTGGETRQTRG